MQERLILGVVPGLHKTGWGIIRAVGNRLSYITGGTIKTNPKHAGSDRLCVIYNGLSEILDTYKPTDVAVEEVYVNENARSSLKLGQARGVPLLVAGLAGLQCAEYTPAAVKKAIVGTGRADKNQIGYMVKMLLPTAKPDSEDAADALAVAICHAHTAGSPLK